jgi:hypothetical protein
VGVREGCDVGTILGKGVGADDGSGVGIELGTIEGRRVGGNVGSEDGAGSGTTVGVGVGTGVGYNETVGINEGCFNMRPLFVQNTAEEAEPVPWTINDDELILVSIQLTVWLGADEPSTSNL